MTDNLVSKFTVNSQGTDINIKIKDEDARNLIAQEISDRDSAVTTLTNNLNKEISDRSELISKDSSGNTVVTSTNGALYFNTKNPIKYSQPVSNLNDFFNIVPYVDNNGNRYNVLCETESTNLIGTDTKFKNYILVGDSYAAGYTPDGSVTGWPDLLAPLLGGTVYAKIIQSGSGLSDNMSGEYNLTNKINALTANDSVDSIICCCGRNDIDGNNTRGITNGIKNFVNACHTKFKNARVYIGFIGWDLNKTEWTETKSLNLRDAIALYRNTQAEYTYINTDFILRQRAYMASDGKHPNQDGQNALAYGIERALYGGIPGYSKTFIQHIYKDQYSNNNYIINETFTGGITFLQFISNSSIQYGGPNTSITLAGYDFTIVKNIELSYLVPSGYKLTTMQATVLIQFKDNAGYYSINAPVYFKDNKNGTYDLVMSLTQVRHDGAAWASGIINFMSIYSSITVANSLT